MIEDKVTNALDWLRNAKDKFRSFATGEEQPSTERPRVGLALAGGMGIVAIAVAAGGTRAEIPAAALLAVVLGRLAIPLVARWPVMVGAAILVDLLIPEDGRYQVSAGVLLSVPLTGKKSSEGLRTTW